MLTFGGKTLLMTVSRVLLYQTISLLVAGFLGPAALAIFSRPCGLIRNAMLFVNKFAFVLTPTASCLHAQGQTRELGMLFIATTRYALGIVLPLVIFLAVMGKTLLTVWMGPEYGYGLLLAILAVGHLTVMVQQPIWNILAGMNRHGRMGLANLVAAVMACILCLICLGTMKWGLIGVAISIALPLTLVNGIYVPLYACRHLEITLKRFFMEAILLPMLCTVPFMGWLVLSCESNPDRPILRLLIGTLGGAAVLGILYWRYLLPIQLRNQINSFSGRILKRVFLID
jgi:O-antigen/teichoic acid export membrane protein